MRDSYSNYVGHPPMLQYMALGLGEPREKVRAMMIEVCSVHDVDGGWLSTRSGNRKLMIGLTQKMIQPVGKPPEVSVSWPLCWIGPLCWTNGMLTWSRCRTDGSSFRPELGANIGMVQTNADLRRLMQTPVIHLR